ncbi:MAG: tRNA (adenosine(37)-N6)-dimethylallyltransferase MiaA, partial [Chloroflexota bacterium]
GMFFRGEMNLIEAAAKIKFETHRYVRQQYNWFRLKDDRIKWFDMDSAPEPEIETMVAGFLRAK